jgi:hypothetical protein
MGETMERIRQWFKRQWLKFKKWVYGILVALGIAAAPLLYAEVVDFTYTRADQYTDGTPLPIEEIQFTRLYCDGSLVSEEPGADQNFSVELGIGTHECYATHVDIYDRESDPSASVVRIVSPPGTGPNPPVIDP